MLSNSGKSSFFTIVRTGRGAAARCSTSGSIRFRQTNIPIYEHVYTGLFENPIIKAVLAGLKKPLNPEKCASMRYFQFCLVYLINATIVPCQFANHFCGDLVQKEVFSPSICQRQNDHPLH